MPRSRRRTKARKLDIAASSGALLFNILPELTQLPASELYARLTGFLIGTLNAYDDVPERDEPDLPEPNVN